MAGQLGICKNSFTREDVRLKLDLTPHLSDDCEIRLEIEGTIDDVAASGDLQTGGPTTNNRSIKTTVVVHDGETVVLGGLQKETAIDTLEKVPLVGDIPVLGMLFTHAHEEAEPSRTSSSF